jgi:hypothetical protein
MNRNSLTDEQSSGRVEVTMPVTKPSKNTPGLIYMSLSGKKQVGKDSTADIVVRLLEEQGKKVHVTAFAHPLKRMCIDILGLDEALVYGSNDDKDTPTHIVWDTFPLNIRVKYSKVTRGPRSGAMTVREVLQVVGTDIFREMFWDNVWAEVPFRKDFGDVDVVILTDCRFPNEKDCTEDSGGVIIRLERLTGFTDLHKSETALDGYKFKHFYENNGSLEELEIFVRKTLEELGLLV